MSKPRISVLYIDDEENNLTSFKATFRRDFDVFVTTRAAEAAEILAANEIHIILADQKMPELSGAEFLELVKTEYPDPIRMLLTGYADIQAVIDAINKGQIYRYITKPWNEQELRLILENAFDYYSAKKNLRTSNAELKKALTNLERFVYSASHEFRAPLVSIRGVLDLLRLEQESEKRNEYIAHIGDAVFKLDLFTQNLSSYHQNLTAPVNISRFNAKELLDTLVRNFETAKGTSDFRISLIFLGEPELFSDEMRIRMAAKNLISNAIEHAQPEAGPTVVEVVAEHGQNGLTILVKDNGQALPVNKLEWLRDTLEGNIPYESGRGLGAFIVKEVLNKLQGKATVESSANFGTKVQLTIPLHAGS